MSRDGNWGSRGEVVRVTKPQVPWFMPQWPQLCQRLQNWRLQRRQMPRLPSPMFLHKALSGMKDASFDSQTLIYWAMNLSVVWCTGLGLVLQRLLHIFYENVSLIIVLFAVSPVASSIGVLVVDLVLYHYLMLCYSD